MFSFYFDYNIIGDNMKKLIMFFVTVIIIIILTLLYSRYLGTKNIQVKEYKIINKNFTNDYYGLKIVHITDIHYGRITHKKELKELVKKVNKTKPDIIVFTGDLIDKDSNLTNDEIDEFSSILSKLNSKIGKYAISGNEDTKNYDLILSNSNFTNLNDKYDTIYLESNRYILISGISSNLKSKTSVNEKVKSTEEFLKDKKEDELPIYSILLLHEPDYVKEINNKNYDLILAGHSLNGQIRIPFIGSTLLPKGAKKYYNSYYNINNTDLYISSGIGTSNFNFRIFNKPSFNLYRMSYK